MEKNRVALYMRVSTDHQVKEGESLEAQESALVSYAHEHNLIIVDKYIEYGESGQKLKRTALSRLLDDVKQGKIDIIILTKLDRWFRSVKDFYKVQEIILEHNVTWKTIWEDYDTSTANGRFQLNVMLSLGELEAQRTAERIRDTFTYKYNIQKTVCTGTKRFGWDIVDKKYVINEKEAELRRQSLEKLIETQCLAETVRWYQINVRNIQYDQIRRELQDPCVIGKYINARGQEVKDFIPAIVDEELYNKAMQVFKNNIKEYTNDSGIRRSYLFSSLIYCGECNHKFSGTCKKEENYYRCTFHRRPNINKCTLNANVSERFLEKYLITHIKSIAEDNILDITSKQKEIKRTDNIPKIKNQINKLTDLYMKDLIDIDYYKKEYQAYQKQLTEEEQKQNVTSQGTEKLEQIKNIDFDELYGKLDNLGKIRFWREIIKEIIVYSKENIKVILKVD